MKLSYTALKTFQQCPFCFSLRYHRGLASRPRPPMRLSRALHGALQLFHQDLKQKRDGDGDLSPSPAPLDSLLAHFTRYYDNPTRPLTESQCQEGKALLTRYVVDLLAARGVTLGFPYSSDIKGRSSALRELRIQSEGQPLRVLYAFDPKRQAVLLLGADKTGLSDDRFYRTYGPRAEALWEEYLREMEG